MVLLKVGNSKKAVPTAADSMKLAQEVFDFLYSKCPIDGAAARGERFLELAHFEPLARAVQLELDDLSIYMLAYLADPTSKTIYKIPEKRFTAWVATLAASPPRNAATPTRENGYAAVFKAAEQAVIALNSSVRSNEEARMRFYQFLYHWCLKGNTASDRVDIAKELWSFFFSATPLPVPAKDSKPHFTGYAYFPRLQQWLDFVTMTADNAKSKKWGLAAADHIDVSLDTWTQLIPFSKMESYVDYHDEDAWPVAMDDFVEHARSLESAQKSSRK